VLTAVAVASNLISSPAMVILLIVSVVLPNTLLALGFVVAERACIHALANLAASLAIDLNVSNNTKFVRALASSNTGGCTCSSVNSGSALVASNNLKSKVLFHVLDGLISSINST
jgi:hypothetical protein